jgi:integrase
MKTIYDLFEERYRPLRLRGRSPNTVRLYHCTIRSYSKWLGRQATLDDLTDLTVSRVLEIRARQCSPYTAEKERTQLCCLWRFAADLRLVESRPMVPAAPLPDRVPKAWSEEDMRSLFRAASYTRGVIGHVPARIWWPALISVLWETAERIGAIMEVEPSDLDPPHLLVRAEYRKGGKRDRVYKLSENTLTLVRACISIRRSHKVFEWHRNRNSLWRHFGDIVTRAGLGCGWGNGRRSLKFHQIRRSAASHYAARGGDPVSLLDHSSPRITKRWYLDTRLTDKAVRPCDTLPGLE